MQNSYAFQPLLKYFKLLTNHDFMLRNFLFEGVKLTKNDDPHKYSYSEFGISFDVCGIFLLPNRSFGKNVAILGAYMSLSVHVHNKKRHLNSW